MLQDWWITIGQEIFIELGLRRVSGATRVVLVYQEFYEQEVLVLWEVQVFEEPASAASVTVQLQAHF